MQRTCFHCQWFESVNSIKKLNEGTGFSPIRFDRSSEDDVAFVYTKQVDEPKNKKNKKKKKRELELLCKRVGGDMI